MRNSGSDEVQTGVSEADGGNPDGQEACLIVRKSYRIGIERVAEFSDCLKYRYSLRILWDLTRKPQLFIGLNPSTADEENDDPTIRRCIDYAQQWGAGGLVMCNAFAFRATDPKAMLAHPEPVGPENSIDQLKRIASGCLNNPIAAWGKNAVKAKWRNGGSLNRQEALILLMSKLDCLRINGDGSPCHPLYLPKSLKPIPYNHGNAGVMSVTAAGLSDVPTEPTGITPGGPS